MSIEKIPLGIPQKPDNTKKLLEEVKIGKREQEKVMESKVAREVVTKNSTGKSPEELIADKLIKNKRNEKPEKEKTNKEAKEEPKKEKAQKQKKEETNKESNEKSEEKIREQVNKKTREEKSPEKKAKEKKTKKEKPASREIVSHFNEELRKIEDMHEEKEYQKIGKCDRALELIEDWLPFGYLDDFKGISKLLSIMRKAKPKTALTFGAIQENLARKIAYEMAFQYPMWKRKKATKTKVIRDFINEWLKEKSPYYQAGEKWKDFWSNPPTEEQVKEQRQENGYFFEGNIFETASKEDRFKADKLWKSFGFSTGNLIKLRGGRDRTLAEISKILAAEGVDYTDFRSLTNDIENQFIKNRTLSQLVHIEDDLTKDDKLAFVLKEKKKLGTLPTKSIKIGFLEKLVEEKIKSKKITPEQGELIANIIANARETLKGKTERERLKTLEEKVRKSYQEESSKEELPPQAQEIINKAKDFIKKSKKKESIWGTAGKVGGWAAFLFFVLFFVGELKAIEKLTGIDTGTSKKKK